MKILKENNELHNIFLGGFLMKKKFIVLLMLVTTSMIFAQSKETIPSWMKNSAIILSDVMYGSNKTVGTLFGDKFFESTNTKIATFDNKLIISNEIIDNELGTTLIKIEATFIMNRIKDSGTCYPSQVIIEVPMTFQSQTFTCSGGPYNNPRKYGEILGCLKGYIENFYEMNK